LNNTNTLIDFLQVGAGCGALLKIVQW
jgi:hypothetical protein